MSLPDAMKTKAYLDGLDSTKKVLAGVQNVAAQTHFAVATLLGADSSEALRVADTQETVRRHVQLLTLVKDMIDTEIGP